MFVTVLTGACVLAAVFAIMLSVWSRLQAQDTSEPVSLTRLRVEHLASQDRERALLLLQAGRKIEAIKLVRERTGWRLGRAKRAIEELERTGRHSGVSSTGLASGHRPNPSDDLEAKVRDLLGRGRKIEAVKLVRDDTGWGLKRSKSFVERVGSE